MNVIVAGSPNLKPRALNRRLGMFNIYFQLPWPSSIVM